MNYIEYCKKCNQLLPERVPANRIGDNIFICGQCLLALEAEKKKRDLYVVPGQDQPYKP